MRILHTADWHFGRLLEGRERRGEQEAFVEELCQIADERQVDLVLIAGDIYDSVNPPAWAEELYYSALERLAKNGRRGVVVIAGNHDQPERVRAAAPLAQKLGIVLLGLPREAPARTAGSEQRVQVVNSGPSWFEMKIPEVDHHAVIVALPYPSEARLRELISLSFTQEEMQQAFSDRIAQIFDGLSANFSKHTVNIVMSHLFVTGASESDSERPIQIGGTHAVSLSAIPKTADYVALGHLHRPQKLSDQPLIRYSGSPLGYSFSEAGQSKTVVLVEVTPDAEDSSNRVREELIYLTCGKPLVRWKAAGGIAEAEAWLDEGRDPGAWIDLELHVTDVIDPAEFQRLRKRSEQLVKIQRVLVSKHSDESELDSEEERERRRTLNPEQLFRRFYERKRGIEPDERMVELFSRFMSAAENPQNKWNSDESAASNTKETAAVSDPSEGGESA